MTAPAYSLDPQSARKGSGSAGSIDETGAYVGKIALAKHIHTDSGASGIQINFESEDGQKANFINVFTHGKDGSVIFGMDTINALMTCLKVRELNPEQREVEEKDFQSGQIQKVKRDVYPDLMEKPVGLILRKEWYVKQSQEDGYRFAIFAPFNAQTGQLATEVLDDKPAEGKDKIAATLKDKGAPKSRTASGGSQSQTAGAPPVDDFDDDIPF